MLIANALVLDPGLVTSAKDVPRENGRHLGDDAGEGDGAEIVPDDIEPFGCRSGHTS